MNSVNQATIALMLLHLGTPQAGSLGDAPAKDEKKRLVAEQMQFTDSEARQFWPIYEKLQREWAVQQARRTAMMGEFGRHYEDMPEAEAKRLTLERLAVEENRIRLFRSYLPKFEKIMTWRKIARYYQIESKLHAAVNAEIAEELPLVK